MTLKNLLSSPISAVNIGIEAFANSIKVQGASVVQVDWRPPLKGYRSLTTEEKLTNAEANTKVCERLNSGRPMLVGMGIASEIIPGFKGRKILHAGPPVTWEKMCGPMQGAVIGGILFEGWAKSEAEARILASQEVHFEPCHHYQAVGPMSGVISPNMPVFAVKNTMFGNMAFSNMNEGLGRVLRFGAFDEEVIQRLKWMREVLFPNLREVLEKIGPIDLKSIMAQALHMGDEVHNRNRAATSLLYRVLAPQLVTSCSRDIASDILRFIDNNDHFFLNLSMAACKSLLSAAANIPGSSIITVMARNGVDFGLQVSGLGDRWFTAKASIVEGMWFPGFSESDANPDLGDSAITETLGLGGISMAAAPAIVRFVGGTAAEAIGITKLMYKISASEHGGFTIPVLNFRGSPLGLDLCKIAETGILPIINTGVAHKRAGVGMIGAGIVRPPRECFGEAFSEFTNQFKT